MTIFFAASLFCLIWFTQLIIIKAVRGQTVAWWVFFIQAASATSVIVSTHFLGIW